MRRLRTAVGKKPRDGAFVLIASDVDGSCGCGLVGGWLPG